MMDNDNGKIIEFPKKKVAAGKDPVTPAEWEHKRALLSVSLGSVLLFSTLFNLSLAHRSSSESKGRDTRGLANVEESMDVIRDLHWEGQLAQTLADQRPGMTGKVGRQPSSEEKLTFGALAGKYSLVYRDGKILQIQLAPENSSDPVYVTSPVEFLADYRELMAIPFKSSALKSREMELGRQHSVIELFSDSHTVVGLAHFEQDLSGRFLSFKMEPAQ